MRFWKNSFFVFVFIVLLTNSKRFQESEVMLFFVSNLGILKDELDLDWCSSNFETIYQNASFSKKWLLVCIQHLNLFSNICSWSKSASTAPLTSRCFFRKIEYIYYKVDGDQNGENIHRNKIVYDLQSKTFVVINKIKGSY